MSLLRRRSAPLIKAWHYLAAIGAVALSLGLSQLLRAVILPNPFILFFAAITFSAWYGGLGPGLLATMLALVASSYFFIPPYYTIKADGPELVRLVVFVFVAGFISSLAEAQRRAEAAAQVQREQLQVTLSSIGDAVIATDTAGRVSFLNSVAEQLTGWSQADAIGQPIDVVFRIVDAGSRAPLASPVAQVLASGRASSLAAPALLIARDGAERAIDDSGAPIRDRKGATTGAVLIFRDVTERARAEAERAELLQQEQAARREAERARQQSRAVAERAQALAAISRTLAEANMDLAGVLGTAARQASELIGDGCAIRLGTTERGRLNDMAAYHPDEAARAALRELVARSANPVAELAVPDLPQLDEPQLRAVADPAVWAEPEQYSRPNLLALQLQVPGRHLGALLLLRDRTSPRYTADDRIFLGELADRVALAIDNARLYHEAQEAVRTRDVFLSVASHELKTPLTSLLGNIQLLERRAKREGNLDERYQRTIAVVIDQTRRMSQMVATLLDVSRIESGQLMIERDEVDLRELARRVIQELQPTQPKHAIVYTAPDQPLVVRGDALRLEQVLQNLIGNAAKYSPTGDQVRVRLAREGSQATISVADDGIGIPESALPRLFQRFYRAGNAELYHISGMGVGLYVVQEIVKLHGGALKVESREGAGSTFTVVLPLIDNDR
jgi:PAS domain S-box-containing protein